MSTTPIGLAGCGSREPFHDAAPGRPAVASSPSPSPALEFTDATFDSLYPVILLRKVQPGPKANLWNRYVGKWVRWTGTLVSFSANGITIKQLPQTVTFDVSLWIPIAERAGLRKRVHKGDRITYIGRLDSYDDVFRTLYLVNGAVTEVVAADGGTGMVSGSGSK